MKTFSELKKDLKQIRAEEEKHIAREEKATAQLKTVSPDDHRLMQSIIDEINAIKILQTDIRIAREIIKNNACIALYNEVMPIILGVLKAYEGKTHGEKTAAKIREELKEKANCFVDISSCEINVIEIESDGSRSWDFKITVGCEYDTETGKETRILTDDNKIKVIPIKSFMLYYQNPTYIEDISSTIVRLKNLKTEAYQQQRKLAEICNKYNALAVGDLEHLNIYKYISDNF